MQTGKNTNKDNTIKNMRGVKIEFLLDEDGNFTASCTNTKDLNTTNYSGGGNITFEDSYADIAENFARFIKSLEPHCTSSFHYSKRAVGK